MNDSNPETSPTQTSKSGWKEDAANVVRGLLMGGADIVPGVSGGTVALIVGIYARLVTAISKFDAQFLKLVFSGKIKEAAAHIDFRFLLFLGIGILTGIVTLASLVHDLLLNRRQITYAAFFGLIAASGFLISKMAGKWKAQNYIGFVLAFIFAFLVVGFSHLKNPPDSHLYTFFCGCVGICAMILPGISGAFLLLILGRYEEVTGIIKSLKSMDVTPDDIIMLGVFGLGCVFGLLAFSRVLKWLLEHYFSIMMSILCGLMFGSLRILWPFQTDTTPEIEKLKHKVFEVKNFADLSLTGDILPVLIMAIMAAAFAIILDRITGPTKKDAIKTVEK